MRGSTDLGNHGSVCQSWALCLFQDRSMQTCLASLRWWVLPLSLIPQHGHYQSATPIIPGLHEEVYGCGVWLCQDLKTKQHMGVIGTFPSLGFLSEAGRSYCMGTSPRLGNGHFSRNDVSLWCRNDLKIDVITIWKVPWLQIAKLLANMSQGMAALLRSLKDMDRVFPRHSGGGLEFHCFLCTLTQKV